jgi:hypothetical protein
VPTGGSFFRKLLAFAGPGYLVAVGYLYGPGACARSRPLAIPRRADSACSRIAISLDSMMTLRSVYP